MSAIKPTGSTFLKRALTFAVGASLYAGSAVSDESPAAPKGSVEFSGHHYQLVDNVDELSWHGAKKLCESQGGYLSVITSQEEANFITGLCDGRYLYLGATDAAEEGTWSWVDGSPWEFTFWSKGQPNNYGGREDFLATYDDGKWVDVDASGDGFWMPSGYICEWSR